MFATATETKRIRKITRKLARTDIEELYSLLSDVQGKTRLEALVSEAIEAKRISATWEN